MIKLRNTLSRGSRGKGQKRAKNLVNVSSKYIGDHQSLACLFFSSSISFSRLFFVIFSYSFVPHTRKIVLFDECSGKKSSFFAFKKKKSKKSPSSKKHFDKILNFYFIVFSFAFFFWFLLCKLWRFFTNLVK